jgi:hypothetical protein
MKNETFFNKMQNALDELTPEERALVAQGTAEDWGQAVAELVVDPTFWGDVAKGFLKGMTEAR